MDEHIEQALASRSPERMWLALVGMATRAKLPAQARPRMEEHHVYVANLRLTRGGDGWVAYWRTRHGGYRRALHGPGVVLKGIFGQEAVC